MLKCFKTWRRRWKKTQFNYYVKICQDKSFNRASDMKSVNSHIYSIYFPFYIDDPPHQLYVLCIWITIFSNYLMLLCMSKQYVAMDNTQKTITQITWWSLCFINISMLNHTIKTMYSAELYRYIIIGIVK